VVIGSTWLVVTDCGGPGRAVVGLYRRALGVLLGGQY